MVGACGGSIERVTVVAGDGGFVVALDDRPAKTPAKPCCACRRDALAAAIAAEWQAQAESVDLRTMPLTRLAATALDRVPCRRRAVIDAISAYGGYRPALLPCRCACRSLPASIAPGSRCWTGRPRSWGARLAVTRGVSRGATGNGTEGIAKGGRRIRRFPADGSRQRGANHRLADRRPCPRPRAADRCRTRRSGWRSSTNASKRSVGAMRCRSGTAPRSVSPRRSARPAGSSTWQTGESDRGAS